MPSILPPEVSILLKLDVPATQTGSISCRSAHTTSSLCMVSKIVWQGLLIGSASTWTVLSVVEIVEIICCCVSYVAAFQSRRYILQLVFVGITALHTSRGAPVWCCSKAPIIRLGGVAHDSHTYYDSCRTVIILFCSLVA